jgi:hypothetical protein
MTPEQLVCRSLGVPDVVRAENRLAAAAQHLAVAAGLDVAQDPNVSHQSQVRLADAQRVVTGAIELTQSGELDGLLGSFGYRDDDWYVNRLIRKLDLDVYENGRACAEKLLELLRAFIGEHPFEDQTGRSFR